MIFVTAVGVCAAALLGPLVLPAVFGDAFDESVIPFLWLLPGTFGYAASAVFSTRSSARPHPGCRRWAQWFRSSSASASTSRDSAVRGDRCGRRGQRCVSRRGATALITYRRVSPFTLRALLVPHRGDLDVLMALAGPLLGRPRRETA